MSKEELFKKYQEIVLKTNGGADDYVVALCQISNLIKEFAEEKDQQITDLQSQLTITEKALELACERVKYFEEMQDKEMGFYEFFGYDSDYDLKAIIEQYKQQAKEMLENE